MRGGAHCDCMSSGRAEPLLVFFRLRRPRRWESVSGHDRRFLSVEYLRCRFVFSGKLLRFFLVIASLFAVPVPPRFRLLDVFFFVKLLIFNVLVLFFRDFIRKFDKY